MPRPCRPLLRPLRVLAAMLWLALPAGAREMRFDVLLRGVSVAEVVLAARDDGQSYAVAARVRATGVAAVLGRVRFLMQAEGRWVAGVPVPRRYAEDVDTGRRASAVEMAFGDGGPVVLRQVPVPGEVAAPAAGAVDPLSALWRLARGGAVPPCGWEMAVFDGARTSVLALGAAEGGPAVTCAGHYTRVAGFPPADMAERRAFPFAAVYAPRDGRFELTEVAAASLFGPIRIVRRD